MSDVERELMDREREFWTAMLNKDAQAAMRLTDETCVVAGPSGVAKFPRAAFEQMMGGDAAWTLRRFEFSDTQVLLVGEDLAVVGYKVHEKLTVEGEPVAMDAADTSTWVRRDGRWLCACHTEAIVGDPYGRDRK